MPSALIRVAVMLVLLSPATAYAASGGDEAAIRGIISQQIEAFRHDDGATAFGFAAPSLQTMFGSADRFMDMVRRGYGPVYRPRAVEFGALQDDSGQPVQLVELIGPDGQAYTARYTMEREADGTWRISACELLESRRVGT